jgi:hypothetical protein
MPSWLPTSSAYRAFTNPRRHSVAGFMVEARAASRKNQTGSLGLLRPSPSLGKSPKRSSTFLRTVKEWIRDFVAQGPACQPRRLQHRSPKNKRISKRTPAEDNERRRAGDGMRT